MLPEADVSPDPRPYSPSRVEVVAADLTVGAHVALRTPRLAFDLDPGYPLQPPRQAPVPVSEQLHGRGDQDRPHHRRVEEHATAKPKPSSCDATGLPCANEANTATMIKAAPVMIEPVVHSPKATDSPLSPAG